jgi:transposase
VIRHVRPKFACGKCQSIVQAAAPSRPIDKGIAGPGLLAHVAVSKYIDHLPLCPHPQVATYEGRGSIDVAANFVCKTPKDGHDDRHHHH